MGSEPYFHEWLGNEFFCARYFYVSENRNEYYDGVDNFSRISTWTIAFSICWSPSRPPCRRLLMMLGDGLSIIGLACILFSLQFLDSKLLIGGILLGAAISSAFSSLVEPSFRTTISDLLEKDEYTKASGMVQLIPASRYLLSPVLAAWF